MAPTSADAHLIDPGILAGACAAAESALRATADDQQAVDSALEHLFVSAGPEVLSSVYVEEHGRLWLLAQRGYSQVLDGFALDQGVMARAVRTNTLQFVPDATADPDFIAALPGLRSEITVPFGDGIGAFNVETLGRPLPPEAVDRFAKLGALVGERAGAVRGQPELGLSTLARLFVYASSLRDVGSNAELASRWLGRLLELDSVQVHLGRSLFERTLASFWRRPGSQLEPLATGTLEEIGALAEGSGAAYGLLDLAADEPQGGSRDEDWAVWLPLRVGGDLVGIIVGRALRVLAFERERAEVATLFAAHAAALIDLAQALARERRTAVTDALTGLLNRRGLDRRLGEELGRAARARRPLAVVLLDCDGLKAINDRGGHALGDEALRAVARRLQAGRRIEDVAARIGGDEFVLLLPELDSAAAAGVAERLRAALRRGAEDEPCVPASLGVASYPADGETPEELLRAADRAMYRAKRAARAKAARPVLARLPLPLREDPPNPPPAAA